VDQIERIFEPYYRASAQRSSAGLGLGLYIVREVARAHGGSGEPQIGNDEVAFVLRLPRGPRAERAPVSLL
jgi:signal transduction histidine kinase